MKTTVNIIFTLFISQLLTHAVHAAVVQQIKNDKVLIVLEGLQVTTGQTVVSQNGDGKNTALIDITTIKDDKAVGKITKGTPQIGQQIVVSKINKSSSSSVSSQSSNQKIKIRHDDQKMLMQVRYLMNSIVAQEQDTLLVQENATMTGNNFGLNFGVDYPMTDSLSLRGLAGYEMYKVSGTIGINGCDTKNSTQCNVEVNYLTLQGIVRLSTQVSRFQFWAGLGLNLKQPLTKKTTALNSDNIQMAQAVTAALGTDWYLNSKWFIPVTAEYNYSLNTSTTVPTISEIVIAFGLGKTF